MYIVFIMREKNESVLVRELVVNSSRKISRLFLIDLLFIMIV